MSPILMRNNSLSRLTFLVSCCMAMGTLVLPMGQLRADGLTAVDLTGKITGEVTEAGGWLKATKATRVLIRSVGRNSA